MIATGSTTSSGRAYVSNSYSDTVSVIDTATNAVIATVGFDDAPRKPTASADNAGTVELAHGPVNPTVAPDGRHVYVAKSVGGGIAVTGLGHRHRVAEPRDRRDDDVERIRRVAAVGDRVGQRADHAQELDRRAGPAV